MIGTSLVRIPSSIKLPRQGPGEDHLHDDGAVEQSGEADAAEGEDRDDGVFQGVLENHQLLSQPLDAGELDVFTIQHFEHGRAGKTHETGHGEHCDGKGRDDEEARRRTLLCRRREATGNSTASIHIKMMASQNWGIDMPRMANTLANLSRKLSRFTADKIPNGMPTATAIMRAATAS